MRFLHDTPQKNLECRVGYVQDKTNRFIAKIRSPFLRCLLSQQLCQISLSFWQRSASPNQHLQTSGIILRATTK